MTFLHNSKTLPPSIAIPKFIKQIAKITQYFPAKITVLFADKLFSSPINFKTPKREQTFWESAQKKRINITAINKEIDVLSYGYSKKKVLLVHGWAGRSTQLFMLADKLLENGYMVISFDGPSHGKSDGKRTNMPEFIETIKQLHHNFGPFESAIGHSFGGMTLYNTANSLHLKSLVTIGAGDTVSEIINRFVTNLSLPLKYGKKLKAFYDKKWNRDIDLHASSNQAKNILIPTLVVHDSLDGDVPVSCAAHIRQNLHNGSLLITHGLGHTKILRDKKTMNRIVQFIVKNQ